MTGRYVAICIHNTMFVENVVCCYELLVNLSTCEVMINGLLVALTSRSWSAIFDIDLPCWVWGRIRQAFSAYMGVL